MKRLLSSIRNPRRRRIAMSVVLAILVLAGLVIESAGTALVLLRGSEAPMGYAFLALDLAMLAAAALLLFHVLDLRRRAKRARDDEFAEMSRRLDLAMEASQIGFWDVDLDTDVRMLLDPFRLTGPAS